MQHSTKMTKHMQLLYDKLKERYVEGGFYESGCMYPEDLVKIFGSAEMGFCAGEELRNAGFTTFRLCDRFAYELTADERVKLIAEHKLDQTWGKEHFPLGAQEIAFVMSETGVCEVK